MGEAHVGVLTHSHMLQDDDDEENEETPVKATVCTLHRQPNKAIVGEFCPLLFLRIDKNNEVSCIMSGRRSGVVSPAYHHLFWLNGSVESFSRRTCV
jgi:hypothetical protein